MDRRAHLGQTPQRGRRGVPEVVAHTYADERQPRCPRLKRAVDAAVRTAVVGDLQHVEAGHHALCQHALLGMGLGITGEEDRERPPAQQQHDARVVG